MAKPYLTSQIVRLREEGLTIREIAKIVGVSSTNTVYHHLHSAGCQGKSNKQLRCENETLRRRVRELIDRLDRLNVATGGITG